MVNDDQENDLNPADPENNDQTDEEERHEIKKRSEWWVFYDEIDDENGDRWVKCKHCDGGYVFFAVFFSV